MLPLQLWDGQYGALNILPTSFDREILCKTFTVAALGVFQPFLLLLAGFLCTHALRCALHILMTAGAQHQLPDIYTVHTSFDKSMGLSLPQVVHAGTRPLIFRLDSFQSSQQHWSRCRLLLAKC